MQTITEHFASLSLWVPQGKNVFVFLLHSSTPHLHLRNGAPNVFLHYFLTTTIVSTAFLHGVTHCGTAFFYRWFFKDGNFTANWSEKTLEGTVYHIRNYEWQKWPLLLARRKDNVFICSGKGIAVDKPGILAGMSPGGRVASKSSWSADWRCTSNSSAETVVLFEN